MTPLFWRLLVILVVTPSATQQNVLPRKFDSVLVNESMFLPQFNAPSVKHRPKFRYWLPDANINHEILKNDIQALREIGAGGLEFVPFYNYGFGVPDMSNWEIYAFGKSAFKNVFLTALESCRANGLVMDYALGASQGQGVPTAPLTPGLAVQLVYGKTSVRGNEQFEGALPPPILDWREVLGFMQPQEIFGDSRLIGVSAAAVVSSRYSDNGDAEVALDEASLIDLSENVVNGHLRWRAPSNYSEWVIFSLYERFTNQRSCVGIPTDVISNGSWVTDHFSAAGARLVTEFWEKNLLDTQVLNLLKTVGHHSWEDSMEIQASLFWTPGFIEQFTVARGYNPTKFLPLLFHRSNSFHGDLAPYNATFYLNGSDNSGQSKYLQDYRLTLNEGYMAYLRAYEGWSQSLGISHSCQVAYNMPVDLLASVPMVPGPELESLGFTDIDHILQFVGPAHLAGQNIISTEIGAVPTGGYSQTVPSLVSLFHDAFAGGVNAMLIHGMPYGGEQPGTTWPGYTPFQFRFTELWSPRQPAWSYLTEAMNYTARNQYILQSGIPKRDLLFYLYKDPYTITTVHNGTDLRKLGFTYEYLSPSNLALENLTIHERALNPDGPGYRALIIDQQLYISPEASKKLVDLAANGLPIVVIGTLPNMTIGSAGQSTVSEKMSELVFAGYPNVKFIEAFYSLSKVLDVLSVRPRVQVASSPSASIEDLYTMWRSDEASEYLFLYNRGYPATFNITMEAKEHHVPHKLNAWTGEQKAIALFSRLASSISIQMTLQKNQSTIIALVAGKSQEHVISHSKNVAKVSYEAGKLAVLIHGSHAASLTLSNGYTPTIPGHTASTNAILPEIEIGPWNLTLESWVPAHDDFKSVSDKRLLHLGMQDTLSPWSNIPQLQNVSGIGTYTATFELASMYNSPNGHMVTVIQFGPVLNTLRAWINGKQLPPVDIFDAQLDISNYIVSGRNLIRVETASTLFNAVKARVDWIKGYGVGPLDPQLYTVADWQPHGLIGPVRIKTLRKVFL